MACFEIEVNHTTGDADMIGVNMGKLTFVTINRDLQLLVFHQAGSTSYVDRVSKLQYAPAEFMVFKYFETKVRDNDKETFFVQALFGDLHWKTKGWKK